jgi:hypothetical protein
VGSQSNLELLVWLGLQLDRTTLMHDLSRSTLTGIFQKSLELYPSQSDLWSYCISIMNEQEIPITTFLQSDSVLALLEKMEISSLLDGQDPVGMTIQKNLEDSNRSRKKYAANYTHIAASRSLLRFLSNSNRFLRITDPFCGSGRLITSYLQTRPADSPLPAIWINDLLPDAVLLAFCRIFYQLKQCNYPSSLILSKVLVTIGDAFERILYLQKNNFLNEPFDLVIMNPPFTRIENLALEAKQFLNHHPFFQDFVLEGQPGLHIYALILADRILGTNGQIATVLPASTFLSQYSAPIQDFLLSQYTELNLVIPIDCKSFSDGSDFREIFFYGEKKHTFDCDNVNFYRIRLNSELKVLEPIPFSVPVPRLRSDRNWIKFFLDPEFIHFVDQLLEHPFICTGQSLNLDIVRGIEMYGPDFFFLPNQFWKIVSVTPTHLQIEPTDELSSPEVLPLSLEITYLSLCLRKPGLYNSRITPLVGEYVIVIPDSAKISPSLQKYIQWTENAAAPAKKQFKSHWLSHTAKQIASKNPQGRLFFTDKFGINTAGAAVFYFDRMMYCTKNFYVLRQKSEDDRAVSLLLGAWLNSSFYFLLFLYHRREIGGSYGRLQIMDLLSERLFLNPTSISKKSIENITRAFESMRSERLPPIPQQFSLPDRLTLDTAIAHALQIPENRIPTLLTQLYSLIQKELNACAQRDGYFSK